MNYPILVLNQTLDRDVNPTERIIKKRNHGSADIHSFTESHVTSVSASIRGIVRYQRRLSYVTDRPTFTQSMCGGTIRFPLARVAANHSCLLSSQTTVFEISNFRDWFRQVVIRPRVRPLPPPACYSGAHSQCSGGPSSVTLAVRVSNNLNETNPVLPNSLPFLRKKSTPMCLGFQALLCSSVTCVSVC